MENIEIPVEEQICYELFKTSTKFGLNLYTKIIEGRQNEDILVSPLSINIALGLTWFGAAGDTAQEIVQTLPIIPKINDDDDDEDSSYSTAIRDAFQLLLKIIYPTMLIANKIYINNLAKINPRFEDITQESFLSEVESIDFSDNHRAAKIINRWLQEKTNQKIKYIVDSSDFYEYTNAILINVSHFKAEWMYRFDREETFPSEFYISPNESTEVFFMQKQGRFNYAELKDQFSNFSAAIIELPFKNCDFSFLIMKPYGHTLDCLERKFFEIDLRSMRQEMEEQEIKIIMPKFNIEFTIELNEVLKMMGMKRIFSEGADFCNMIESYKPVHFSKILHKSFLDINEEGAEVRKHSIDSEYCEEMYSSEHLHVPIIDVNVPFIYMIVDKFWNILLLGKYCKPKGIKEHKFCGDLLDTAIRFLHK